MKIELAKAGVFGAEGTNITPELLQEVKETFDGEVPVVIGHSLADFMPAFGWVKSLEYDPDTQTLYGDIELNDLLKDAFDKELYKKWSVGIRRRASDNKSYLHHVAFLGAVPPKIKDLKILDGKMVNMADAENWTFELSDKPKPPPLEELDVEDIPWDALEARKRVFDKYGIEGLKKYCLYQDKEQDPNNKGAYKFLVVDIKDGKPVVVAKALSAALAYLHGARGVEIKESIKKVVEPKVKRLLKKKEVSMQEKEKNMADEAKREYETKIAELADKLKKQKTKELEKAIEGKLPKEKAYLVKELADSLNIEETIELSDENGKRKVSAFDILLDIFSSIPLPVEPGKKEFADKDGKEQIDYNELLKHV